MITIKNTTSPLPVETRPIPNVSNQRLPSSNAGNVPEASIVQAEQFVEELGSVELAKLAVDLAKQAVDAVTSHASAAVDEAEFYRSLGFATKGEFLEASAPIESNDGKAWFITCLPDESLVVWNDVERQCDRHFITAEEARASVPRNAEFAGSSLLG